MRGSLRLPLLALLHAADVIALCLPNGIPATSRTYSTQKVPAYPAGVAPWPGFPTGADVPYGLWFNRWESATIFAAIIKILVEEKLGYHVNTGMGSSSPIAWAAVSGCQDSGNGSTVNCEEFRESFTPWMGSFEIWYKSTQSWHDMGHGVVTDAANTKILFLGDTGYSGRENMAISAHTVNTQVSSCPLDFYKMLRYSESPWLNFNNLSSVKASNLKICQDTDLHKDTSIMRKYLAMDSNPDLAGVTGVPPNQVGKCWDSSGAEVSASSGTWWLSPTCRLDVSKCIPLISDGKGWGFKQFVQYVRFYDMPVALAAAAPNMFDSLVGAPHKTLLYTYTTASQKHGQSMVLYPVYNEREWTALDLYITDDKGAPLDKAAWIHLAEYFPKVVTLGQRVTLSEPIMVSLLQKWVNSSLPESTNDEFIAKGESIACDWLKNNPAQWQSFVPLPFHCASSEGVVLSNGTFSGSALGDSCVRCPPGRFSKAILGGSSFVNYICEACEEGYEQDRSGHVGSCNLCRRGKYAATKGTSECSDCPRGRYANTTASSYCDFCSAGMYQAQGGKSACGGCPAGTYRVAPDATWLPGWDYDIEWSGNVSQQTGTQTAGEYLALLGASCLDCSIASYQEDSGQTACVHCSVGYVTPATSAKSMRSCVCPSGSYSNFNKNGICEKCPEPEDDGTVEKGLFCPGGFVEGGLLCPNYDPQVGYGNCSDPTVLIEDGFMSMPENPLDVYACDPKKRCKGRRRPFPSLVQELSDPNYMESHTVTYIDPMCTLHGVTYPGCARCDSGDFFNGDTCKACSDLFFPAVVIALLIWLGVVWASFGLYYSSMFPPNPVSGTYGPVIGLFQCISLTLDQSVPLGKNAREIISVFAVLKVDFSIFAFPKECVFSNDPVPFYSERVIWPILLILAFLAVWGLINGFSTLVCKISGKNYQSPIELFSEKGCIRKRFDLANDVSKKSISGLPLATRATWFWTANIDDIANVLNKTAHSLFISLANGGLIAYITVTTPGGSTVLKSMPGVKFAEGDWWGIFPFSLFGILVYNIGYFAYVVRTVYVSPRTSPGNVRFCKRNRGLWAKYDPESWWFCIPAVIFSLSINLTALAQNGRMQTLLGVVFTAGYIGFVSTFKPYKFILNHQADLFCKMGYLIFLLTNSLVVTEEPLDPTNVQSIVIIAAFAPIGACLFIGLKFLWYQRVAKRQKLQERVEFAYRFLDTVNIVGHWDTTQLRNMCFHLLDNDLSVLNDALDLLSYKLLGFQPYKSMKRYNFMPNPATPEVIPFKMLGPGQLEGICQVKNLNDDARPLIRELRDKLCAKHSTAGVSEAESPKADPGAASPRNLNPMNLVRGPHVKQEGLLFRGLPNGDKVAKCMNLILSGNIDGDLDVDQKIFVERMRKILGPDCYDDATLKQIFAGLDLEGSPGVEPQVDQYELAVQLSVCEPTPPTKEDLEKFKSSILVTRKSRKPSNQISRAIESESENQASDEVHIQIENKPAWPIVEGEVTQM